MKIIFVDDANDNLKLFKIYTKGIVHECHFFSNPEEALESMKNEEYALSFIDIQMPVMDGKELVRKYLDYCQLNNKKPGKLCALTGTTAALEVEKIIEAGFENHIVKPILKNQILAIIEDNIREK